MKKHITINTSPFTPYTPHKHYPNTERTLIPIKHPPNPTPHKHHVHFSISTPTTSTSSPSNTITTTTHHSNLKRVLNPPSVTNQSLTIATTITTPRSKSKKQKKPKNHFHKSKPQTNRNRYILNRYVYKYDITTSNEIEL